MKTCTVCKQTKAYVDYYKSNREKDGFGYRCKKCDNMARKTSRNRDKPIAENKTKVGYKRRWLMWKYGLRLGEYEEMLAKQGYRCAICKTENPRGTGIKAKGNISFAVDHCHTTNKVRGLLCNLCNRALGLMADSTERLQAAIDYLNKE